MSFQSDVAAFFAKLDGRIEQLRSGVETEIFTSIVDGSPITGAPGQPVDKNNLKDSWTMVREGRGTTLISSDSPYAEAVEENWSGVAFQNHGPHSLKQTIAGFPRLVEYVGQRVMGEDR